jgi:hypothetical protein
MNLQNMLGQQRVKYIASSYELAGEETDAFDHYLQELLSLYPTPLIELSMVEALVDNWLNMPLVKGSSFLEQVHQRLKTWEYHPISSTLTPEQFQQITGLNPQPVFGPVETLPKSAVRVDPPAV